MKTVYLGMSGGVDSSVSAVLLKEQGYKVVGVYMKNWSKDLPGMKCPWAEDLADAKRVAVKLDLDFEVWDFEKEYKEKVVDYMLSEFKKGNTPNPDIMCNQEIKFKLFYDIAREKGADFIATGHYARVSNNSPNSKASALNPSSETVPRNSHENFEASEPCDGRREQARSRKTDLIAGISSMLLRAIDENKDQTYFLYRISNEALNHTIFPVGSLKKPDVKKLAEKYGLSNAYKKESMGVCFVGEVGMKDFLKEYLPDAATPGEIREIETEKLLGYHDGIIFYTIGQRHGLYVGGGLPYYVVKKDAKKNLLYVSKNLNHPALWTDKLELKDVILRPTKNHCSASTSLNLLVRLRHRAPLIPCTFNQETNTITFKEKIKRPASGQSAVLYSDQICLGGGIIRN